MSVIESWLRIVLRLYSVKKLSGQAMEKKATSTASTITGITRVRDSLFCSLCVLSANSSPTDRVEIF